jgi:hypothetical protein
LCKRWLSHISECWRVEWDHLISRPDALEQLKIPGTLQLLSGQDDAAHADPGWTEAHLLLRKLVVMGLHRLPDICDGNTIVLPTTISGEASPACRRVLNSVTASRGSLVRWVDMTPNACYSPRPTHTLCDTTRRYGSGTGRRTRSSQVQRCNEGRYNNSI